MLHPKIFTLRIRMPLRIRTELTQSLRIRRGYFAYTQSFTSFTLRIRKGLCGFAEFELDLRIRRVKILE